MVVEKVGITSIWCSDREAAELDVYFFERFDRDDAPFSELAADLGVDVYDHDWLERIECVGHGLSTVGELIRRTGGGHEMSEALGPLAAIPARLVVVLHHAEVREFPTTRHGEPHPLRHLANVPTPHGIRR